jgi:predicted O-methyltransferase YrrM
LNSYQVFRFLRYALFSSHRKGHGIHSPFVYNLVTELFRNKIDDEIVCKIENIRKRMLREQREIETIDYGAGGFARGGMKRKISDIARRSLVPRKYGILLASLSSVYGNGGIAELGTSLGISSMYLASGSGGAKVYTVEGCPATASVAAENIKAAGFTNIELITGTFDEVLPSLINESTHPGLIFIDGDHRGESLRRYFGYIAGFSAPDMVIVIDDIHYSEETGKAWESIKSDPRVTLTVDIFRMGMVFFRGGMTRSDYIIRY